MALNNFENKKVKIVHSRGVRIMKIKNNEKEMEKMAVKRLFI